MKYVFSCLVLFVLYSCAPDPKGNTGTSPVVQEDGSHQNGDINILPYPFDTLLKNGYHLSYRVEKDSVDDEMIQHLFLTKGNREIAEINANSYGIPFKSLGYIGADFGDTFAFIVFYGSGNPDEMRLIQKETGSLLKSGFWVGVHEEGGILLYVTEEEKENEMLMLYDVRNKKERAISDFKRSECVQNNYGGHRNCIDIDMVTDQFVVLKIDSEEERIVKRYRRG